MTTATTFRARRAAARRQPSGFTLIEILIVVIILGILAAIVIPQFSSASGDARKGSAQSTAQTLKSQVALYRLQHGDTLPTVANLWTALTTRTDVAGAAYVAGTSTSGPFGPYMQDTPVNSVNSLSIVVAGDGSAAAASDAGWVYDYGGGTGTGKVWATDADKRTLLP